MPTVLIVDDNATLAYFTARNLEKGIQGLDTITAGSCEDAFAAAAKQAPSVLIADVQLQDGSGLDLVDAMMDRFPEMPAILISGDSPGAFPRDDLFGFLPKPYEAEDLVGLVRRALHNVKTPSGSQEVPAPAPVSCDGYDHHRVQNQLGELVSGLRSLEKDLRDRANDPKAIHDTVDHYVDRLCSTAMAISRGLPRCPENWEH